MCFAVCHGHGAVSRLALLQEHIGDGQPHDVATAEHDDVFAAGRDFVVGEELDNAIRGGGQVAG